MAPTWLPELPRQLQDGPGSFQDASCAQDDPKALQEPPRRLREPPSRLQEFSWKALEDPEPPPEILHRRWRRPKAASKSSPEAPRVQAASNKPKRFQEPTRPRCQERAFSSLLREGSESACCHLQHHKMQSFSKPTTAKASCCITPKEITEVSECMAS